MTQLNAYRQEIFNFVSTLTIKFDMLGIIRNKELVYTYDINENDKTTWCYYLHLSGQYHASDTMMDVVSVDTGETIDFTIANLNDHPKTKLAYKPGTKYYKTLLKRYPTQIDLIRSIVYPVDINMAIEADDFTLLSYDSSYLENTERHDLVEYLKSYLRKNSARWYVEQYNYEELYPIAFWAILWYTMPLALFSKRWANIHTSNVHSFHVWEYLTSNGLSNYKNILTTNQALFLYRNLTYIYKNRGKDSTLLILAEHILKPLKVAIFGKMIHQNNVSGFSTYLWTPEMLSDDIVDYTQPSVITSNYEDISSVQRRLYSAELDPVYTLEHNAEVIKKLATTDRNILPTKLVEIVKYTLDNKYQNLLYRFVLETFIQRIEDDLLTGNVIVVHDRSGIEIILPIQDIFILLYYSIYREVNITPVNLPDCITMNTAYTHNTKPDIQLKTMSYFNDTFVCRHYVDIDDMVDAIRYDDDALSINDTTDLVADQFSTLVSHIRYMRSNSSKQEHLAVERLYNELIPMRHKSVTFSEYSTYAEWFSHNESKAIVDHLDGGIDIQIAYSELSLYLLKLLFPMTNTKFKPWLATNDDDNDEIYKGLKNLFTQLCSYNIAFLDTNRANLIYYFLSHFPVAVVSQDTVETTTASLVYEDYAIIDGVIEDLPYVIDPVDVGIDDVSLVEDIQHESDFTYAEVLVSGGDIYMYDYLSSAESDTPKSSDTTYVDTSCDFAID